MNLKEAVEKVAELYYEIEGGNEDRSPLLVLLTGSHEDLSMDAVCPIVGDIGGADDLLLVVHRSIQMIMKEKDGFTPTGIILCMDGWSYPKAVTDLIHEALQKLPKEQREETFHHWIDQLPAPSNFPGKISVASIMGLTRSAEFSASQVHGEEITFRQEESLSGKIPITLRKILADITTQEGWL